MLHFFGVGRVVHAVHARLSSPFEFFGGRDVCQDHEFFVSRWLSSRTARRIAAGRFSASSTTRLR